MTNLPLPGQRIRIASDYYALRMRGKLATVVDGPFTSVIVAEVDGLFPLGHHGGKWTFARSEFELV